jgi:hypothetical protein
MGVEGRPARVYLDNSSPARLSRSAPHAVRDLTMLVDSRRTFRRRAAQATAAGLNIPTGRRIKAIAVQKPTGGVESATTQGTGPQEEQGRGRDDLRAKSGLRKRGEARTNSQAWLGAWRAQL